MLQSHQFNLFALTGVYTAEIMPLKFSIEEDIACDGPHEQQARPFKGFDEKHEA